MAKILIDLDKLNKYLLDIEAFDNFLYVRYRTVWDKLFVALYERGGLEYVEEDSDIQKN